MVRDPLPNSLLLLLFPLSCSALQYPFNLLRVVVDIFVLALPRTCQLNQMTTREIQPILAELNSGRQQHNNLMIKVHPPCHSNGGSGLMQTKGGVDQD